MVTFDAWNTAVGNDSVSSACCTMRSRCVTLSPATESTLASDERSTVIFAEVKTVVPPVSLIDTSPVTPEVRDTASWVELWPANCSVTRYPATEPEVTFQVAEPLATAVGEADDDAVAAAVGEE